MNRFYSRKYAILILAATVILLFGGSLNNGFLLDDHKVLTKKQFNDIKNLPSMFIMADTVDKNRDFPYYRPITQLTYFLDYWLWRLDPFWYHVENVLLHMAVVLLLYTLVLRVFEDHQLALFSALIFAVHPVVSEPVNFVAARNNILCAAAMLGSLICFKRSRQGELWWAILSLALYLIALLSKEPAVSLPAFVILVTFLHGNKEIKVKAYLMAAFIAVTVAYFALRANALGNLTSNAGIQMSPERFELVLSCLYEYYRLMLAPVYLSIFYNVEAVPLLSYKSFASILVTVALTYAAINRNVSAPLRVSILWLLVSFLPVSNLVIIPSMAVADRYLYIPLLGFSLAVGYMFKAISGKRPSWGLVTFLALAITLAALTYQRNSLWRSEILLWKDAVSKAPSHSMTRANLANKYLLEGMLDKAIDNFLIALELDPDNSYAHSRLGRAYMKNKMLDEAIKHFTRIIYVRPDAQMDLAIAYREKGLLENAERMFIWELTNDFNRVNAYINLGLISKSKGDDKKFIEYFNKALELNPQLPDIHFNLGNFYVRKGILNKAEYHYLQELEINIDKPDAHRNLGHVYNMMGLTDKAEEHFQAWKALTMKR
jgi:tetratricopeptide (TPR) repeat protein